MLVINNEATADAYAAETTLESAFGGRLVYVVANASAIAQFKPLRERGGSETAEYGPEILLTPQASFIDKISAARFKSAVAGSPARIVAQLSEPGDVLPASGTPFSEILSASGQVSVAEPSAKVGSGSVQSLASGTTTVITFTVERWDNDNIVDIASLPDRLTCRTAGKYGIWGCLRVQGNATGRRILLIQNNTGGYEVARAYQPGSGLNEAEMNVYGEAELVAGQFIQLVFFQDSGVALNTALTTQSSPAFGMTRVSA